MASIHPFRALRPAPDSGRRRLVCSLRRRQHRRGASARGRQSAQLPARHALRDRSAARCRSVLERGLRQGARRTSTRCAPARRWSWTTRRLSISTGCAWAATSRPGIAGCFSLDEYDRDVIKKHERTRRDKEDDRTRHMVEPPRADGRRVPDLSRRAIGRSTRSRPSRPALPLYDFTAADGVQHTIWRARLGADQGALVDAFARIPALYIADGHHRAASAARARTELGASGSNGAAGRGHVHRRGVPRQPGADPSLQPHREGSGGRDAAEFLAALRERVPVGRGHRDAGRGRATCRCTWIGRWYALDLSGCRAERRLASRQPRRRSPAAAVLEPILRIGDIRTDKRIDFVGGARGTAALEQAVDSGKAAVAFSMYPVTVGDLMAISDAGGIMPPKSTWFEPKLRDGLLIHDDLKRQLSSYQPSALEPPAETDGLLADGWSCELRAG